MFIKIDNIQFITLFSYVWFVKPPDTKLFDNDWTRFLGFTPVLGFFQYGKNLFFFWVLACFNLPVCFLDVICYN